MTEAESLLAEAHPLAYGAGLAAGRNREGSASRAFHRATGINMMECRKTARAAGGAP